MGEWTGGERRFKLLVDMYLNYSQTFRTHKAIPRTSIINGIDFALVSRGGPRRTAVN